MHRTHALATAAATLAALAAAAPGASAKTVEYSTEILTATLSSANGYPAPGGTGLIGGRIQAKPFGAGGVVSRVTITGQPQSNAFTFVGSETDFYARGSQRTRFTGTSTVNDDGSVMYIINGRFTKGTGRYRGVKGRFTFIGRSAPGSSVVEGTSHGHISY